MPGAFTSAKEVQDAAKVAWAEGNHLILVFGASWCPNCAPFKQELADTIGREFWVVCAEVDLEDDATEELVKEHAVTRLPTLVILNGKEALCKLVAPPMAEVRTAARAICKPKLALDEDF